MPGVVNLPCNNHKCQLHDRCARYQPDAPSAIRYLPTIMIHHEAATVICPMYQIPERNS